MNITKLLSTKIPLRFNEDGKFRILMISDIHGGVGYAAEETTAALGALLDAAKPDLLLLGGDTCGPGIIRIETADDLRTVLSTLTVPIEERGIPWANVLGNHETDHGPTGEEQVEIYSSYPHCLTSSSDECIHGTTNYVLPIFDHKGEKILFNVFALDDNMEIPEFSKECSLSPTDKIYYHDGRHNGDGSVIMFDQIMWYWNTSCALEEYNGAKIPAMMFMHIPIPEFQVIVDHRTDCKLKGYQHYDVSCSTMNAGLFAACLQRGDVKGIFCGHDHENDFCGKYCGITLAYDGFLSYHACHNTDIRGGRIIDLDASRLPEIETSMIRVKEVQS